MVKLKEEERGRAFKQGARYLGLGLTETIELYEANLHLLESGMSVGKTNAPVGLQAFFEYSDMMHGGAYASPVGKIPFFMADPTKSKWYAGELRNLPQEGLASYLAKFFSGTDSESAATEIIMDGNVPHVFPKFLSDQAYAAVRVSFGQAVTTDLFKTASTGVSTLVEGPSKAYERVKPKKKPEEEEEGYSEELMQEVLASLAMAAKTAAAVG